MSTPRKRNPGKRYTLAVWEDGKVVDVENGNVWIPEDPYDLREIAWRNRLMIGCESVGNHPWLLDIIRMPKGVKAFVSKEKGINAIAFIGSRWGTLQEMKSFDIWRTEDWLAVRDFFDHMGFDGITIGSVADGLMWQALKWVKNPPPVSFRIREVFEENVYGGRTILAEKRQFYSKLWEIDFNKAYLHWIRSVPDPKAKPFLANKWNIDDERPAFVHASLITRQTYFAPLLARRQGQKTARAIFEDGEHLKGWWWAEELRAAKEAGWDVIVKEAIVWPGFSNAFTPWAELMLWKLETAPTPYVKNLMKTAYSAQIGRFQMRSGKMELRHGEARRDGHPLVLQTPSGIAISDEFWIEEVPSAPGPAVLYLPQGSYIVMRTRLDMYNVGMEMLKETGKRPVRGHVDNLYYDVAPPQLRTVVFGPEIGQMKMKVHTDAIVEGNRVISTGESGELIRIMPGISGESSRLRVEERMRS